MDQELQARIAPITSRLHMLVPKSVSTQGETRQPAERAAKTSRRRPGQLVRTTA
jgi:hypothetical protein